MPHRRTMRKGSFGDQLDELVKHFPDENHRGSGELDPSESEKKSVHDRLFEKSWRAQRRGD